MPRILHIDPRAPSLGGVLIKRQAVSEQQRIVASMAQLRSFAKRYTTNVQRRADLSARQAMRNGYQAGLKESLRVIVSSLCSASGLQRKIEQSIRSDVKRAIETSLQDPDLELQLIDGWLATGRCDVGTEIRLIVPHHAARMADRLRRRIEEVSGITPVIVPGERNVIVIQSGDQVFEFCPEHLMYTLGQFVEGGFLSLDVRGQCEEWGAQIYRQWADDLLAHQRARGHSGLDCEQEFDSESALNYYRAGAAE